MLEQVEVYYEGWGERWLWGTLVSTTAITRRPQIVFEYSDEAKRRGLELSSYTLPLKGPQLRQNFPAHQLGLPGPVYDALPDGWGMLLMDRMFRRRHLNTARIGPLERLAYIGNNAMGGMSFEPVVPEGQASQVHISLDLRATQMCTNDVREKAAAFERAVFNVVFNNRDDHPKNFAYLMSPTGTWTLAPAYDVTFCEGPGGYHQMDVMGEALAIDREAMLRLAEEAEVSSQKAGLIIDHLCEVASRFSAIAENLCPRLITLDTLSLIQGRIDDNIGLLRQKQIAY